MRKTEEELLDFTNMNLNDIVTPVDAWVLRDLLTKAGYNRQKTDFLFKGFSEGFSLRYQGKLLEGKRFAPNLKLRIGSKTELWNKVMKEVQLGRYAGPFDDPPFEHFVQSPIGLVPKDQGKKTRLIFHLPYPKDGDSVNSGILREFCSVKYPDFEQAVKLCIKEGRNCSLAKSDMSSAFRHVPLALSQWALMVMMAIHPVTGVKYYFVDKCLPFGSSISCAIFQAVSDAIAFLVKFRSRKPNVNYLDDYLFAAAIRRLCDKQVEIFLEICEQIHFPVALEKTYWSSCIMVFLGLLLDTARQLVCIPEDKIRKALNWIEFFMNKKNKKVTILQVQKLCGTLNFLCKCIVPGRAFLRRLYARTRGMKQHHHVKLTSENMRDFCTWKFFLEHPSVYSRSFILPEIQDATVSDMYSDASRNFKLGFGAYCGPEWTFGKWEESFCEKAQP